MTEVNPLAYTISEAMELTRTGRTALYQQIRDGKLSARKRGGRTLILATDLRAWLNALPIVPSSMDRAAA